MVPEYLPSTGGAIDNTSGADLTLNPPASYTWAGSFSFLGTSNLDLNFETSYPNGTGGGNITLTVVSNTLTTEGDIVNNNTRVIKNGNGTWEIAGRSPSVQSLGLLVTAGQVNLHKGGGQCHSRRQQRRPDCQTGALVLDLNNYQIHSDSRHPHAGGVGGRRVGPEWV